MKNLLGGTFFFASKYHKHENEAKSVGNMNTEHLGATESAVSESGIEELSVETTPPEEQSVVPTEEPTAMPTATPETKIKVPNVVGLNKTKAIKKIRQANLKYKTDLSYSTSVKKGRVISQSKKASTYVKKNTVVKLVISKGAKATPSPTAKPTAVPTAKPKAKSTTKPKATKKPKTGPNISVYDDDDMVTLN